MNAVSKIIVWLLGSLFWAPVMWLFLGACGAGGAIASLAVVITFVWGLGEWLKE
jgi:hypothetical protein